MYGKKSGGISNVGQMENSMKKTDFFIMKTLYTESVNSLTGSMDMAVLPSLSNPTGFASESSSPFRTEKTRGKMTNQVIFPAFFVSTVPSLFLYFDT